MKARLHKSRQQLDTMSVSTAENVGFRWLKYLTLITDSVPTAQRWLCHTETALRLSSNRGNSSIF